MSLFIAHRGNGLAFFRLLGFGLHVKDTSRRRLIFSERAGWSWGHRWAVTVGAWRLRLLYPWDHGQLRRTHVEEQDPRRG